MGYTFISFVGQQNLGVQNPLEACLQAKNSDNTSKFDIDKIRFFPKNGGIHFYHNVQAFNVDSRSTLKA